MKYAIFFISIYFFFSIEGHANVKCSEELGEKLWYPAINNDLNGVKDLLDQGACANGGEVLDRLPIKAVALNGNLEIANLLLSYGADINYDPFTLCYAIRSQKKDFVVFALDKGFNIGTSSYSLHCASKANDLEMAKLLITRGSPVNDRRSFIQPLGDAVLNQNIEMVRVLLAAGANPSYGMLLSGDSETYSTPLVEAIKASNASIEIIRLLIEAGADVNWKNDFTGTAIQAALLKGNAEAFDLLVSKKAKVNQRDVEYLRDNTLIASELLKMGFDLKVLVWGTEKTLLFYQTKPEMIEYLVNAGLNINHQDKEGSTAFFLIGTDKYLPILKKMIDLGADLNIKNSQGGVAFLDWVCQPMFNNCELFDYALLNAKPFNVEIKMQPDWFFNGQTPLMYIVSHSTGYFNENEKWRIKRMVELGANLNAVDNLGKSVLDYSTGDVREYLISLGAHENKIQ